MNTKLTLFILLFATSIIGQERNSELEWAQKALAMAQECQSVLKENLELKAQLNELCDRAGQFIKEAEGVACVMGKLIEKCKKEEFKAFMYESGLEYQNRVSAALATQLKYQMLLSQELLKAAASSEKESKECEEKSKLLLKEKMQVVEEKRDLFETLESEIQQLKSYATQNHEQSSRAIAGLSKEISPLRRAISPLRRELAAKDAEIVRLQQALLKK